MSLSATSVKLYINSMRKSIKYVLAAVMLMAGASAFSQNQGNRQQGNDWMARMRSEKIAFLTTEIGLTPEEAQAFWPIYNKAEAEDAAAFDATMKAYRALEDAVRQKKSEKEISKLLDDYVAAANSSQAVNVKYVDQYKKVLSAEKVAKLFVAEERFRNNQILRLQGGGFNQNRGNGNNGVANPQGFGFPWRGNQNQGGQRQGTQKQEGA